MDNNLIELYSKLIFPSVWTTLYMVSVTAMISTVIGFTLAIILVITNEDGLKPNEPVYKVLNTIINIIRSFPFIILLVSIIPLTRLIAGTSIGPTAAIVPLTVASSPFIARLIETSLRNVDSALIEAAKSFGATNSQIVFKVMVKESIPSIISNITMAIVAILGSTAMAGAVGAGGLGAVALTYGYQNFNDTIMYGTVVILIILVQLIQFVGNSAYKKSK